MSQFREEVMGSSEDETEEDNDIQVIASPPANASVPALEHVQYLSDDDGECDEDDDIVADMDNQPSLSDKIDCIKHDFYSLDWDQHEFEKHSVYSKIDDLYSNIPNTHSLFKLAVSFRAQQFIWGRVHYEEKQTAKEIHKNLFELSQKEKKITEEYPLIMNYFDKIQSDCWKLIDSYDVDQVRSIHASLQWDDFVSQLKKFVLEWGEENVQLSEAEAAIFEEQQKQQDKLTAMKKKSEYWITNTSVLMPQEVPKDTVFIITTSKQYMSRLCCIFTEPYSQNEYFTPPSDCSRSIGRIHARLRKQIKTDKSMNIGIDLPFDSQETEKLHSYLQKVRAKKQKTSSSSAEDKPGQRFCGSDEKAAEEKEADHKEADQKEADQKEQDEKAQDEADEVTKFVWSENCKKTIFTQLIKTDIMKILPRFRPEKVEGVLSELSRAHPIYAELEAKEVLERFYTVKKQVIKRVKEKQSQALQRMRESSKLIHEYLKQTDILNQCSRLNAGDTTDDIQQRRDKVKEARKKQSKTIEAEKQRKAEEKRKEQKIMNDACLRAAERSKTWTDVGNKRITDELAQSKGKIIGQTMKLLTDDGQDGLIPKFIEMINEVTVKSPQYQLMLQLSCALDAYPHISIFNTYYIKLDQLAKSEREQALNFIESDESEDVEY